ncbi:hypothetical protein [Empedobacter brevis]|uniref:hypothetical protein n=1 Tax=Empedobacter brevis TaxID=247 RepID=UPI0039AFB991
MKFIYLIGLVCFAYIGCVEDENISEIDSSVNARSSFIRTSTDSVHIISSKNDPPQDKDPYVKRQDNEDDEN